MRKLCHTLALWLDRVCDAAAVLAGLLFFIPAVSVAYEVVSRGLFDAPTEWVVEVSTYLVLVAGFLGLAATYRAGSHISVDILTSRLMPRTRAAVHILTTAIGLFFCAVLFRESLGMALMSYELDMTSPSTLHVPMWIPQSALPAGAGLLLLQFLRALVDSLYSRSEENRARGTFR
ncbi:MAG: TRAP transporter small permease, partial [Duodenibacillus sp.]|nr:TRAP transporter small permease [Duodenibacillus sp.]